MIGIKKSASTTIMERLSYLELIHFELTTVKRFGAHKKTQAIE